jgi:hypothetical protein
VLDAIMLKKLVFVHDNKTSYFLATPQLFGLILLHYHYHTTKHKKSLALLQGFFVFGDSAGARTQDPILKRDVLYQLSY